MSAKSARKWSVIFLVFTGIMYFVVNFQRVAVPGSIFNQLQTELHCTAAAIIAVSTAFMYTYALIQLPIGLLVDKFGGGRVFMAGCVLFCIGGLLFPLSGTLTMLYISRIMVGLGAGAVYLSIIQEYDRLFPKNFAFLYGVLMFVGYSSGIVAGQPMAAAVGRFGWRGPMMAAGIAGAVTFALCCVSFFKSSKAKIKKEKISILPVIKVFMRKDSWIVLIAGSILFAIYYILLTCMGKKFLEDVGGMSPVSAAGGVAILVIVSAVANLLAGSLISLCGNRRKIFIVWANFISLAATVMMIAGILFKLGGWCFFAGYVIFAVSTGANPASVSLMREVNNPENKGAASSASNFFSYLLVAAGGSIAGFIIDLFKDKALHTADAVIYPPSAYLAVFAFMLVLNILACFCSFKCKETFGKNCYNS